MRMRQDLATFEEAFYEEMQLERNRRERLRRDASMRSRRRRTERIHKAGTFRFVLLVLAIVATAVGVTVAMFQVLYIALG